jgi:peptidyl-tRNA hydrolase, PTH1 family
MTYLFSYFNSLYYSADMKLIFAQGNPGDKYAMTRHNVGFQILDEYAAKQSVSFSAKPKFFADIAELSMNDEKVLLIKPTTFYNETGKAARVLADFYKVAIDHDILVVHDELALPLGTLRTREKGSDAGNNGIKSLNAHLGPDYARLRIGIYNDLRDMVNDVDFVLSRFTKSEQETLNDTVIPKTFKIIDSFAAGSFETTTHN